MTTALGKVLRGSTTSPAMTGASSRPANPKQRLAKKRIVGSAPKSGMSDPAGRGVAEPKRVSATTPTSRRAAEGIHCAMPPMFWTQRPVFIPMMLKTSAMSRSTRAAPAVYVVLCSRWANRRPKT
jgi:hypothetical protein